MRPHVDGGSLRAWLLALVMVPVLGVAAAASVEIVSHSRRAIAVDRVDTLVRGAADIGAVRADLKNELLPAFSGAETSSPQLDQAIGLSPADTAALATTAKQLPHLRGLTDRAIATLARHPELTRSATHFGAVIQGVRLTIDTGANPASSFAAALAALAELGAVQNDQVAKAVQAGADPATGEALDDLEAVSRACEAAGEQTSYFLAAQYPAAVVDAATARASWLQSWARYRTWSATVLSDTAPATRAAWELAVAAPAVRQLDAVFDATVAQPLTLASAVAVQVIVGDPARNAAFARVQAMTVDRVVVAVGDQHERTVSVLVLVSALSLLVVIASLGAANRVRRYLTRPLVELAQQARKVGEGELVDVRVSGPREVRTVARGLAVSVSSLRAIEAQAAAVVAGDLQSNLIARPVPGALGAVVHASVGRIAAALNDSERAQRALAHSAAHDALTELPNRAQAMQHLEGALRRARRASAMTGLLFVDLDRFKAVNDTFGHAAGDEVLQTTARRLQQITRGEDPVARLGGDEFLVIVESVGDEAECVRLAHRIIESVEQPIRIGPDVVQVGASVGVAICQDGYVDADRLLREADAAVYRAKSSGRGQVGVFDDALRLELAERSELEAAMRQGLRQGEFLLRYQPVVNLASGQVQGVEALIRWQRPGFGLVSPDDFIPVAERSVLINEIGRWVLSEATSQLARWREDPALAHLQVGINISGRHMADPKLPAEVTAALAASGASPRQVVIEVTETILVDNLLAERNMHALRELGVLVAIDDFGTGYTSIGQLPMLAADVLKIDRSFIESVDPGHGGLVPLIVAAAHAFGLYVVAEGIETAEQADLCYRANIEAGQGYFYARPGGADQLERLVRDRASQVT